MDDGGYRRAGPEPRVFESVAGTDSIRRDGDRLVVYSPEPMPEWRVGRYRRTAIRVQGQRYAVIAARPAVAGHEYVLELWPPVPNELASQEIVYDDAYVRARQEDVRELRWRRRQAWAIAPAWPVLGFLPRSIKTTLQLRVGFEPVAGTRRSVILELVLFVLLCVFTWFRAMNGVDWLTMKVGGGGELRDALVGIAILADLGFRASILFDDDYVPYGFWEWVAHPELKERFRRSLAAYKRRKL